MRMSDEEWDALRQRDPRLVAQVHQDLKDLAAGRRTWAELLKIPDEELIGLGKRAAAAMDVKRHAEAEEMFSALTRLDPYVPWFWMALGDARTRSGHTEAAIQAYSRCIEASAREKPPLEELRPASFRRGSLYLRLGQYQEAFEDLKRVVDLDTAQMFDGERAYLALRQMADEGRITAEQLETVPRPN